MILMKYTWYVVYYEIVSSSIKDTPLYVGGIDEKSKITAERGNYMTMTYGYYYGTPMMTYINYGVVLGIAVFAALILGVVLFFAFFRRKNEGKFHGWKGKLYHFMNFNRFYAEDILRFIYIVCTSLFTIVGIVTIILGAFITGILELVVANVILRIRCV